MTRIFVTTHDSVVWTADLKLLGDEALEEVNRLWTIAQVLSNTVHSVRNSLQVTAGNAELMEARPGLEPSALRRLQTIRAQSVRAAETLESLLAYSRAPAQGAETVDIGALVGVALDMRSHSLGRARIGAEVTSADEGPYLARVRRRELLQLFLNVVLATESVVAGWSGATIVIRLGWRAPDVLIDVTGRGTPALSSPNESAAGFGPDLQDRVMNHLARGLGAVLRRDRSEAGEPTISFTVPVEEVGRASPQPAG
jgi:signal transduction histidine kinase